MISVILHEVAYYFLHDKFALARPTVSNKKWLESYKTISKKLFNSEK